MEITRLTIQGAGIEALVDQLVPHLDTPYLYALPPVQVLVTEKHFFRTNSNLLSTLIIACNNDNTGTVDLVSGGGSTGLIGFDWGAEQSRNRTIVQAIEQVCSNHGWQIVQEEWDTQS